MGRNTMRSGINNAMRQRLFTEYLNEQIQNKMKTINTYQKKGFVINQLRYDDANLGGNYSVEVTYNDNIIFEKDCLTLDASREVFLEEINNLNRQVK